jgi:hypothetical protein
VARGRPPRCEGKRRQWRRGTLGTFKCGRVARYAFETRVGLTRRHRTCGDAECVRSITNGYPAYAMREL